MNLESKSKRGRLQRIGLNNKLPELPLTASKKHYIKNIFTKRSPYLLARDNLLATSALFSQ